MAKVCPYSPPASGCETRRREERVLARPGHLGAHPLAELRNPD